MKPRRGNEGQGSLDSLLDTMTNVVGILVFVLIITQLKMADAMRRIGENLPQISEQQMEEVDRRQKELEERARRLETVEDPGAQIEALRRKLEELRQLVERLPPGNPAADLAKVRVELEKTMRELAARTRELEELRKKRDEAEGRRKHLESIIQAAPPRPETPPVTVRLPNPRPSASGARPLHIICQNNRLHIVDIEAVRAELREKLERGSVKPTLVYKDPKTQKPVEDSQAVFDPKKVMDYLTRFPVRARGFDAVPILPTDPKNPGLQVEIRPSQMAGLTDYMVRLESSPFGRTLKELGGANRYLHYYVYPDSFPIYVEARTISERIGAPAGWELMTAPVTHGISGIKLFRGAEFFKPNAPPAPPPTTPEPKKPPPSVLD